MWRECECESEIVGIYPCSGSANVGIISTNQLAIGLTKAGKGKMLCTAGIGAKIPGQLRSAEGCDRVVVIDGCPMNCASKIFENAGIAVDEHIFVTELGVKKTRDMDIEDSVISESLVKCVKLF
ncbi:putative zinc-binding protein [Methanococcoides sp.]|uniref:putative zinc-binding protein n=1 Tax=Methanococcoides sp. TaxID=1966350 RepID=UPI00272E59FD|nr:putative zinc-binding protein [Methanococcoides sp.]